MSIIINHPVRGNIPLDELQADVDAAKKQFHYDEFSFTYLTVQALIDKIKELSANKEGE